MSSVVAIVKSIVGQVVAVSPEGIRRVLIEGDRLLAGEQVLTGPEGSVTLQLPDGRQLDMGRDSQWSSETPTSTTNIAEATAQAAPSVAELQQAIAAGADPTKDLEATAAGQTTGTSADGGNAGGGHSVVMLTETADVVNPNIGFNTAGLSNNAVAGIQEDAAVPQRESTLSLSATSTLTEEGGALVYTATVTQAPLSDLTITLSNGSQITIAAGQTTGSVTVQIPNGNTPYLDAHDITTTITGTTGGAGLVLTTNPAPATTTITDTIDTTVATITGSTQVTEGQSATYTISLSNPAQTEVTINLTYSGTAANGTDYTQVVSVKIPAGSSSVTFDLATINDTIPEGVENVTVSIGAITGGNFENVVVSGTNGSVTTTIIDNDALPVVDLNGAAAGTDNQATFTEGDKGVAIAPDLKVTDVDSPLLQGAKVTLTNAQADDSLVVGSPNAKITVTTTTVNGQIVLTLSGAATSAEYEAVIKSITFGNSSENPSAIDRNITVTVNDGQNDSVAVTSTVHVVPVNDAPVVTAPTQVTTAEDTPLTFSAANGNAISIKDVDANPTDVLKITVTVTGGTLVLTGGATSDAQGHLTLSGTQAQINAALEGATFTPVQDSNNTTGTAGLSITVDDQGNTGTGGALTGSQSINIDVTPVNDAPVAGISNGTGVEDTVTTGQLVASDVDKGDVLTYTIAAKDTPAGLTLNSATGQWTLDASNAAYQHLAAGQTTTLNVPFTVTDAAGATSTSTLTIVVTGTNDAPVAQASTGTGVEDTTATGQLQASDVDDNDVLTYSVKDADKPAGFTVDATGKWTLDASNAAYQHLAAGDTLNISVPFTVTDKLGATSTSTLTITLTGTNDAPVATVSTVAVDEDKSVSGQLNATDIDDNDVLTYTVTDANKPAGFTVDATGKWTLDASNAAYQHLAAGQTATLDIPFTVTDKSGATSTSTLTITVTGTNDAPVATVSTAAVDEDKSASGQLQATDIDDNDVLTYTVTDANKPAGFTVDATGKWTLDASNAAYQHLAAGQTATLDIPFTVTDKSGATSTSTLTITVTGTNDAPVATVSTAAVDEDKSVSGQLQATDIDDNDVLTYTVTDANKPAGFTVDATGKWTLDASNAAYQHLAAGQTATLDIPFTVTDKSGATSTSTLTITVTGTNDAPVATVSTAAVDEDKSVSGQLQATDIDDNDVLTYTVTNKPAGFTVNDAGQWTLDASNAAYQHLAAGQTATLDIPFTVTDKSGATSTSTLTITVTGTNDAPVATVSTAAVDEDKSVSGQLNATDVDDNDALTYTVTDANKPAGFTVNDAGQWTLDASNAAYQHLAAGQTATLDIPFTVTDKSGATSTSTLTITVTGTNDAPVATVSTGTGVEDTTTTGQLQGSDVDDGDVLTYSVKDADKPAGFSVNDAGQWTLDASNAAYQHLAAGQTATLDIPFTVTDKSGATSTSTLTITVTGTNDAPVATVSTAAVDEDKSVSGQLQATDIDDNDVLTYTVTDANKPAGFTLDSATGQWTLDAGNAAYQHLAAGEKLTIDVPFTVTDKAGATSTSTLTLTITGTNDVPVASASVGTAKEDTGLATGQLLASDPDSTDTLTYSIKDADKPAGFTLDSATGKWTLDTSNAAYQNLAEGEVQTIKVPFTVTDNNNATSNVEYLTLTVTGTNDAPVAQAATVSAVEDQMTGSGVVSNATNGSSMVITVTTTEANQKVSFNWNFSTSDYKPYNDFAFVQVNGKPATTLSDINAVGSYGSSGNQTFSQVFDKPGTYQIVVGVANQGDSLQNSTLNVGNVTGATVNSVVTNGAVSANAGNYVLTTSGETAQHMAQQVNKPAILSGELTATDIDHNAVLTFSQTPGTPAVDGFTLNAQGKWTFDPSNAAYQSLAAGEVKTIVVNYTVTDEHGATDTSTLTIKLTGTNDAPIASATIAAVNEDASVSGQLQATDIDHNDVLTYSVKNADKPAGFTVDSTGKWTLDASNSAYQHLAAGQTTTLNVPFTVTDKSGATSTSTLTITVTGTNDAPVASASSALVLEDKSVSGKLQATDIDDNDVLTYTVTDANKPAGFSVNAAGQWTLDAGNAAYQHLAAGQTTVLNVPFTVTDKSGATSTSTLKITVIGTNDAPIAKASIGTGLEDTKTTGQLQATDVDDNDVLSYSVKTADKPAGFSVNAAGQWTLDAGNAAYQHLAAGQTTTLNVPFTVTDKLGASSTSILTITVTGTNDAPVAKASTAAVTEDKSVSGQLQATDVDDNDVLTYTVTDANKPAGFSVNAAGQWTLDASNAAYQHLGAGQTTVLNVPFTVTDKSGATSTSTLKITVTGTNDAPVAQVSTGTGVEDTKTTGQLQATDVDDNDVLSYSVKNADKPAGFSVDASGKWTLDAGNAAYQHLAQGQTTTLTVPFTVTDKAGLTSTSTLTITVTGTNDAPVAKASSGTGTEDTTSTGQLQATDVDDNDVLTYSVKDADKPAGFSVNDAGQWTLDASNAAYQHLAAGQTATLDIPFTVTDKAGLTSTSTLTITVTGTNDAPVATVSTAAVDEDKSVSGQLQATDIDDNDVLTYTVTDANKPAGFTVDATGKWTLDASNAAYQHLAAGQTATLDIPFTVTDKSGATSTSTLTITVTGTNDAPVATVSTGTGVEDTTTTGQLQGSDVDDGDVLTYSVNDADKPAGFSVDASGKWTLDASNAAYQHLGAGQTTTLSVPFTVTDKAGLTSTSTLTITVTGTNDAPVAKPGAAAVTEDKSVSGQLQATDVDDGDVLTYTVKDADKPAGFTLDSATGQWTLDAGNPAYQHLAAGEIATVTVPFTVTDKAGATSTSNLVITITG
ncbi:retention module-containing protein, partial [Pseudomonas putida]|uniref:retention module-containing protein n=1 Tax=Pseudomonas putida TaxID=303 RepID=UPI002364A511